MNKIRVLIAEDHTIVRKGLRSLLESEVGIEVVGEAENGRDALAKVQQHCPDIVLMDISMPDLNGFEATRQIKQHCPEVKVLVLTMHANEEYVWQILRAGASGYVVKHAAPDELILAIQSVFRGDSFLSPSISKTVIAGYLQQVEALPEKVGADLLTPREREVLQLLAEGHATRDIAERLYLSVKTVETHRAHILDKLNLHNTAELVKYAIRTGVIQSDQ
jgi:two-component system response regulator NreC